VSVPRVMHQPTKFQQNWRISASELLRCYRFQFCAVRHLGFDRKRISAITRPPPNPMHPHAYTPDLTKSGMRGWISDGSADFPSPFFRVGEFVAPFLPRCMECRRGLAIRILSVHLSVCPSHAWIVTKLKKDLSRFLYHTKDNLA